MKDITVFFSWQSDLNPKETRYIIQEAIKAAKRHLKNIVPIESDRDEDEIKEYILTPINGSNEYRVNVSSLRPDEKSWLGIIALHDDEVTPVVRYKVWSENTDGSVEGTIQ